MIKKQSLINCLTLEISIYRYSCIQKLQNFKIFKHVYIMDTNNDDVIIKWVVYTEPTNGILRMIGSESYPEHTTSTICCRATPNLTSRASSSLAAGLAKRLYFLPSKISFISRSSFGPCSESESKNISSLWVDNNVKGDSSVVTVFG